VFTSGTLQTLISREFLLSLKNIPFKVTGVPTTPDVGVMLVAKDRDGGMGLGKLQPARKVRANRRRAMRA
jgi:hypothetical protein